MKEKIKCTICNKEHESEELAVFDENLLCADCLLQKTVICHSCGKRIWKNASIEAYGEIYCDDCYQERFTTCSECGCVISAENANYYDNNSHDENPYCNSCYCEDEDEENEYEFIYEYNYKPFPIFYGEQLFLGVELEIDGGGADDEKAEEIILTANTKSEHIYIKHDGSLDDGFEIVTHPMSLAYHTHTMPWKNILRQAVILGYRSHQNSTCGLHTHVNRDAFGDTEEKQEAVIARILFFVEKHWDEMLRFSRRTENQINRWASRYGLKDSPKEVMKNAKDKQLGRYVCINLENYSTIEFRIFRGTLRYETLIATLQIVDEICRVAISMFDDGAFQKMTWNDFVLQIPKEKQELIRYLKSKNLYVNEAIEMSEEEL